MPGVPTHGPWCKTRTWPTDCPTCRQSVFYFSCTCDSGVFFDCLGPPWPIHHHGNSADPDLPPWLDDIRRIAAGSNVTIELRKLGISVIRPAPVAGRAVPPPSPPRPLAPPQPDPIVAVPPGESETRQFTGTLREIARSVNPMKAFGYNGDGAMAVAMAQARLGSRWVKEFGRITVYTPRPNTAQQESYTAWIPASLVKSPRIKPGIAVSVTLAAVDVSDRYRDWYCDRFRAVR